jgi:ClpP class serine protease
VSIGDGLFFIFSTLQPMLRQQYLQMRACKISQIEDERKPRMILLVHPQETMRFLGFPIARYIDIDDSEEVMRAIQMTDADVPIDLVLHTPGDLVLAALRQGCARAQGQGHRLRLTLRHVGRHADCTRRSALDELPVFVTNR